MMPSSYLSPLSTVMQQKDPGVFEAHGDSNNLLILQRIWC
jgi:hypothetical protein